MSPPWRPPKLFPVDPPEVGVRTLRVVGPGVLAIRPATAEIGQRSLLDKSSNHKNKIGGLASRCVGGVVFGALIGGDMVATLIVCWSMGSPAGCSASLTIATETFREQRFGEANDVWSFGVTCIEVLDKAKTPYITDQHFYDVDCCMYSDYGYREISPSMALDYSLVLLAFSLPI